MNPYFAGYAARMKGNPRQANPFPAGSNWFHQWFQGWTDGAL